MKHIITLSLLFIAVTNLVSCNKTDATTPVSKDYSASIKEKSWWGEITYTGKNTEYYSVYFKADGTLLWSQLSGDYPGHWAIKDKELTMTFDANSVAIEATLTDDDYFTNISDNTNLYEVNNGAIVAISNITLDNTTRSGSLRSSPSIMLQMTFTPGGMVQVNFANSVINVPQTYKRTASGGSFRFLGSVPSIGVTHIFGVVTSSGEIKGTVEKSGGDLTWYLGKL